MFRRFCLPLALLAFVCSNASAQYVWVDEKGNKQFSDTPPPASVPKNRILKAPRTPDSGNVPQAGSEPNGKNDTPAAKPPTLQSKNEDFNKRRAEQAEKDKKAAETQQLAAEKQKNCERARTYQKTLNSGIRIATTDNNGERSYLSDSQKDKEMADVNKILSECQ